MSADSGRSLHFHSQALRGMEACLIYFPSSRLCIGTSVLSSTAMVSVDFDALLYYSSDHGAKTRLPVLEGELIERYSLNAIQSTQHGIHTYVHPVPYSPCDTRRLFKSDSFLIALLRHTTPHTPSHLAEDQCYLSQISSLSSIRASALTLRALLPGMHQPKEKGGLYYRVPGLRIL